MYTYVCIVNGLPAAAVFALDNAESFGDVQIPAAHFAFDYSHVFLSSLLYALGTMMSDQPFTLH